VKVFCPAAAAAVYLIEKCEPFLSLTNPALIDTTRLLFFRPARLFLRPGCEICHTGKKKKEPQ
jgi:hypothetical protein